MFDTNDLTKESEAIVSLLTKLSAGMYSMYEHNVNTIAATSRHLHLQAVAAAETQHTRYQEFLRSCVF